MHIFIGFAILLCIGADEEFRCKPRPGCHLAKCDPQRSIDLPGVLERNEYPITCARQAAGQDQERQKTGYCPMRYNGKCFWIEVRYHQITFKQGKQICESDGGLPANVQSKDHHHMLVGYLRMFAGNGGYMHAWLGMTYSTQMNTALLSNGTTAPFALWHSAHPLSQYCCNVYMQAHMDWRSKGQHMLTGPPILRLRGVICEK